MREAELARGRSSLNCNEFAAKVSAHPVRTVEAEMTREYCPVLRLG